VPAVVSSLPAAVEIPDTANINATPAVLLNEAGVWILTFIVLAIVRFWERRPFSSIGFERPSWRAIGAGALVVVALAAFVSVAGYIVEALGAPPPPVGPTELVLGLPVWVQAFVALTAGFTEEVLFRGYPIERITELTGSRWAGAVLPVIIFAGAHIPFWGVLHGLMAGLVGVGLTILYIWRRSLWTNIAAHALWDLMIFVIGDIYGVSG
jgi:membrane protease YdiL (CAAX protease family)